jgi:hypothetical protein
MISGTSGIAGAYGVSSSTTSTKASRRQQHPSEWVSRCQRNGKREIARRLRQIASGHITEANGLVRSTT